MSAPSTSKSCPSCDAPNDAGARFCSRCGASLGRPCPACGAESPPDARFCPACGEQLEGQPPLEERKFVTVLFADLVGSTKLGEGLDAEKLKDVMDVYFKAMREEIERFGGTVQKFIGDAVMATFGAPVAHEDDPERALRAARAMLSRLAEVNGSSPAPMRSSSRSGSASTRARSSPSARRGPTRRWSPMRSTSPPASSKRRLPGRCWSGSGPPAPPRLSLRGARAAQRARQGRAGPLLRPRRGG